MVFTIPSEEKDSQFHPSGLFSFIMNQGPKDSFTQHMKNLKLISDESQ